MSDKPEHNSANSAGKALLQKAYELQSPDDSISYYDQFAQHYDADFVQGLNYRQHSLVAKQYLKLASNTDTPILDIGCGTGVLGEELLNMGSSMNRLEIDGADISAAMLKQCKTKQRYRNLFEVDLTNAESAKALKNDYGAVLSSGTFTHGHLGTEPFMSMLEFVKPGGLLVVAINKQHYSNSGFSDAIKKLEGQGRITQLQAETINIYASADHEHAQDEAFAVSFRKI